MPRYVSSAIAEPTRSRVAEVGVIPAPPTPAPWSHGKRPFLTPNNGPGIRTAAAARRIDQIERPAPPLTL